MLYPKYFKYRSQDLEEYFHDAGQFYWGSEKSWLKKFKFFGKYSDFYEIPKLQSQDIDTLEDFKIAEVIKKYIK